MIRRVRGRLITHMGMLLSALLPPTTGFHLRAALLRAQGLALGRRVRVTGRWFIPQDNVLIGDGTWIGHDVKIVASPSAPVSIGARCDLGPGVSLITGTHAIGDSSRRAGQGRSEPIVIEDGCWLGASVLVASGVTIGAGSVIAAGAVVVSDIPSDSLAAGIPARVMRSLR